MSEQGGAWSDWLAIYEQAYASPTALREQACPRCAARELSLVFTERSVGGDGYANLWCGHCLHGIHVSRSLIPEGATVIPRGSTAEQENLVIPDCRLVWPDGDDGEQHENESEVF
ncbi:hypothetical protein [Streptomyces litchfieldiae]|uniref:Uncharacterized protein n=1 Tax=Streptomyces litchfieldiae TaxID=3075543 RepID=A0ABU2N182_9ACTN|nr:hypothetical protein [Streptomyces sp. DSM 44938]MDT0347640.1 hypothetical protein [Streptomyces sp. DSM 44938]